MVLMNLSPGQGQRHRHREQTCGHNEGRRRGDELGQQHVNRYITTCKTRASGKLQSNRELSPAPCDNLEDGMGVGWEGGSRRGTYIYLWLIHDVVRQKPTQHCKANSLQRQILKDMKFSLNLRYVKLISVTIKLLFLSHLLILVCYRSTLT